MLKSIACLRNATSRTGLKSNSDIQVLYFPKMLKKQFHHPTNSNEDQDERSSKSHGTLIVVFASDESICRILYYSIESLNDSQLLQSDMSFLHCKYASFPKAIQVFSLQNDPAGVPILVALSGDGCLYKSPSLIDMDGTEVSVVECKLDMNVTLIGMDLLSPAPPQCYLNDEGGSYQSEDDNDGNGWMLAAGSCSLSPPMIVILPREKTGISRIREISGLEETYYEITAIKIFHKSSIDRNTWDGIKFLWTSNAKGSMEPIWDSINLSIAMFGYADGSVYVAIVSMGPGSKLEASSAVRVYEPKTSLESIISFCLVNMRFDTEKGTSEQLLFVGSLGSIFALSKVTSDDSYGFTKFLPSPFNDTTHIDSSSSMGLLVQAQCFPARVKGNDKMLTCSILVITNDGSSHLLGIERAASNNYGAQKLSGYHCKSPLRSDIASLVTCAVGGQSTASFVACLTMRGSFHLFINSMEPLISEESMNFSSDLQMREKKQSSNNLENMSAEQSGRLSIDRMIHYLAALDGTKNGSDNSKDFLIDTIESTRSAYQLLSSISLNDCDASSVEIQVQDKSTVLLSCNELSNGGDKEPKSHSSLIQSETMHICQPLPFDTKENNCRVLAKRADRSDDACDPLDVFYGGLAQSNSVIVGMCNKWNVQIWNPHKHVIFKSTTISFDDANDDGEKCNRMALQEMPRKRKWVGDSFSPACLGLSLQRKKSYRTYFPFFDILEKVPSSKRFGNGDLTSALNAYRKSDRMVHSSDELEYLAVKAANTSNAEPFADTNQAFSSIKIAIPQSAIKALFADSTQYIGPIPGLQGTFVAVCNEEGAQNEGDSACEVAIIEIGCCALDQRVANANINAIQAALKESFFLHGTEGRELPGTLLEIISKTLSEPNTKHIVKVLKKVCSQLANEDVEIETCIEVYKKLRSLPLSREMFK